MHIPQEMLDQARDMDEELEQIDPDYLTAHKEIKNKKALSKLKHKLKRYSRGFKVPQKVSQMEDTLGTKGIETEQISERINKKRRMNSLRRIMDYEDNQMNEEVDEGEMMDEGELQ